MELSKCVGDRWYEMHGGRPVYFEMDCHGPLELTEQEFRWRETREWGQVWRRRPGQTVRDLQAAAREENARAHPSHPRHGQPADDGTEDTATPAVLQRRGPRW